MTAAATPISAAAEQQNENNDNQDQFHGTSPVMAMALCAAYQSLQRRLQSIVPDKVLFTIKPTAQFVDDRFQPGTMPR
jgi:hypothetical protein